MSNEELPLEMRKAMEIIQNAKAENGWMSAEEYKRTRAELRKLGIMVIEDEPPVKNKQTLVEDVQIHPWAMGKDGNLFNPWCSDAEGEEAGWNVPSS